MGKGPGRGKQGKGVPESRIIDKYERNLLRKGLHNKREREILVRREQRKLDAQAPPPAQVMGKAPSRRDPNLEVELQRLSAQPATRETRLAEAEARGLSGAGVDDSQALRRLARARAAEEAAKEADTARLLTPAAASLLESLRADLRRNDP